MGDPAPQEFLQSQLSLKNFLNRRRARQEVLCKYSGINKRLHLKKYGKLRPQGQWLLPGAWSILTR
jgi:hypothetical protein